MLIASHRGLRPISSKREKSEEKLPQYENSDPRGLKYPRFDILVTQNSAVVVRWSHNLKVPGLKQEFSENFLF